MSTHFNGPVVSENGFQGSLTLADPLLATDGTFSGNVAAVAGAFSGAVTAATLAVGGGSVLTKIVKGTVAVDPASLALGAVADLSVTISGAAVGDTVIMNPPATALAAGFLVGQAWVSSTNTVKIRFFNAAGTDPLDVASATWDYCLIRK